MKLISEYISNGTKTNQRIHQQFFEKVILKNKQKYFEIYLRIYFNWYRDQPKNTPTILWKFILPRSKNILILISNYISNGQWYKVFTNNSLKMYFKNKQKFFEIEIVLWYTSNGTKTNQRIHQQFFENTKIEIVITMFFQSLDWPKKH